MQVYKYMDIGTCKPEREIVKSVPHHLIDIVEPDEQFNAGEFVREADKLIKEIIKRGNIPVLAGGTAFYFRNFIYGMPKVPKSKKKIRDSVLNKLKIHGLEKLYFDLRKIDHSCACKISSHDKFRILRALEVYEQTGNPISFYKVPNIPREDYSFLLIGLMRPKKELHLRIEQRVNRLFENGLVDEVKELLEKGYNINDPGMKGIGYREILLMKDGSNSLYEVRKDIKKNSKAYAKRQMTFFNAFDNVLWYHPDSIEDIKNRINVFNNS